jgi:RNA polymerase sigma-70 factor (ECF subfamily)
VVGHSDQPGEYCGRVEAGEAKLGRVCIDVLRSRKARPEASYDDRLPELVVTEDGGGAPEDDALLAESVGLELLVVLDTLGPTERLAFVLHDMFAVPFEEIGQIIAKSTDATKMVASGPVGRYSTGTVAHSRP